MSLNTNERRDNVTKYKRIGAELIKAREKAGYKTTTAAAAYMNMDRSKLSAFENNLTQIHVDDLMWMSTKLNAPELLGINCNAAS